jgi:hypothetical protein
MHLRLTSLISVIALLALYRVLPHPPNFTPLMAAALFAGAHFADKRLAFLLPLLAMLLADLVIGLHATLPFVYAGMLIATALGIMIRQLRGTRPVVIAALVGSLSFFILTNFGTWLMMSPELYSRDWAGLTAAYVAAIPFYQNSLLSDIVFTAILFGGWALAERFFPQLAESQLQRAH